MRAATTAQPRLARLYCGIFESNRTAHRTPARLDATQAFHLVIPSLPGYGFSGKPTQTGWSVEKMAETPAPLPARLGYDRYLAQGGDWGSAITTAIGRQDPEHCIGIHLNMITVPPDPNAEDLTEQELSD